MAFTICRASIAPVMCKLEASYGTDPTPAAATDDLRTYNSSIVADVDVERFAFDSHSQSFTNPPDIIGARRVNVTLNTLWQGSGTLGTIAVNGFAALDALMSACASTSTAVAVTSITYKPSTVAAMESATVWINHHGYIHKVNGLLGNIVMRGNPRTGVELAFRGMGKYVAPVAVSTTFDAWTGGTQRARPFLGVACTINNGAAYTPVLKSFEFDMGVRVEQVDDANNATGLWGFLVTDRNPTLRVRLAADTDGSAAITYDEWYTDLFSSGPTTHAVAWTVGAGLTGNSSAFSFPTAQLIEVKHAVENGHRVVDALYKLQHATAESEWSIVITSA